MTREDLIDAGFREFPIPSIGFHLYASQAYQKRYRGQDDETLFFVEVYYYSAKIWPNGQESKEAFSAEVNLYPVSSFYAWNTVQFHAIGIHSVEWLEAEIFRIYRTGLYEIDRHNQ